ncbi:molybdopterin synthase sulfur carrier subunit [Colwelliaceae bacterium 6471]
MINILFFAALREQLACDRISIAASDDIATVEQLKQALVNQHQEWHTYLENSALLNAVNHEMVTNDHPIKSGDEVAFFPPVTGG